MELINWENYCALDGLTAVQLGYKWLTFVSSMIAGTHFANVKTFPQGFKKITFFFFLNSLTQFSTSLLGFCLSFSSQFCILL